MTADLLAPPPCVDQPDGDTVALYTFEGSGNTITDTVGNNPGQIIGVGITRQSGKTGCGQALYVPSSTVKETDTYVEIPNSSSWDLASGSVDFWVRFDAIAGILTRGIVSRDASGTEFPGHFTVSRACDESLVLRLQLSGDQHFYLCSDPVSDEDWHHVGINFGPLGMELFVNGIAASRSDPMMTITNGLCVQGTSSCGTGGVSGIDGNYNPWVVGATASVSEEGQAIPAKNALGGAIDSLRISSSTRTFDPPASH